MKIGVILMDHGEPPVYDRHTYNSFRDFATCLIEMGFIPPIVLRFDRGTILQDRDQLYPSEPSPSPELIDTKLEPYNGSARYVPEVKRLRITLDGIYRKGTKPHYLARKAGPGYGEPDFYETYGFEIYHRWQMMGGRSPYHAQTQPQKEEVARRLKSRYGDEIIVKCAYGIDPCPQQGVQTPHRVVNELIREGVTHIAVAEHFSVISDSMSTHHTRKHVRQAVEAYGEDIPIVFAEQLGGRDSFNAGIVLKVTEELERLPRDADVGILLSNHGFPLTRAGRYNASKDCYHENVKSVYESARKAIEENVSWGGGLEVFQVFGQFTEERYNPGGEMLTPLKALDIVAWKGFKNIIDIPYEFPGDSVDVLVKLRNAYGLERLPDWNEGYETRLKKGDVEVKITGANFHPEHWIEPYFEAAVEAIDLVSN
jgi:hypothetical protein